MIRTFAAASPEAAFHRIRRDLGEAAVIVEVRRVRGGVEVDAHGSESRAHLRRFLARKEEPEELTLDALQDFDAGATLPPAGSLVFRRLGELDFPATLATRLASIAGNGAQPWALLTSWLERRHPAPRLPTGAAGPRALGFLGPQGVGRSTLVRGLSARAAIQEPGRIVWLQVGFPGRPLPRLGDLDAPVGVDLRQVHRPLEIEQVADDHGDVSVVLLDLPGFDPHQHGEVKAMQRFLRAARGCWPAIQLHGVLPARWSTREAARSAEALRDLGAEGLAWTATDRVGDPGTVLATCLRTEMPPSFLHGDPAGDGSSSRAASWAEIVGWLRQAEVETASVH